jgi:hypothetical protein
MQDDEYDDSANQWNSKLRQVCTPTTLVLGAYTMPKAIGNELSEEESLSHLPEFWFALHETVAVSCCL